MKQLFISYRVWVMLIVSILCGCSDHPKKTIKNLENSALHQHNVSERYHIFSTQARKEGFGNVSNLFEAISCSENIYAEQIERILRQYGEKVDVVVDSESVVGLTIENLNISSQLQAYKAQVLLPIYISEAVAEEALDVNRILELMRSVSQRNFELCRGVMIKLTTNNSDWTVVNSWSVCPVCGYSYETAGLSRSCRLCREPASSFVVFQ